MSIARWIPNATNTHSEYNTVCFSALTMVERRHLHVTLYVHCLSCLFFDFFKSRCLLDYVEKYGTNRQATDDNVIRRRKYAICLAGH